MQSTDGQNLGSDIVPLRSGFQDWHPMKGPMVTQTLQDIIGKEPFHWRGDRTGIEAFASAYTSLLGDDVEPDAEAMQRLEDYLATIAYPPNPYRAFDNSLRDKVDLPRSSGSTLTIGNAREGRKRWGFRYTKLDQDFCASCHSLPTGAASNEVQDEFQMNLFHTLPPGPDGERHHALFSRGSGGGENVTMKGVQLRNLYEKTGFDLQGKESVVGFGFRHDSSVDTLERLLTETFDHGLTDANLVPDEKNTADTIAFLLSLSGETRGLRNSLLFRPAGGTPSLATHAAVGQQLTLVGPPTEPELERLSQMHALAEEGVIGLVAHDGQRRGYRYLAEKRYQSDRAAVRTGADELVASASPDHPVTWTVVPEGSQVRLGTDRDGDGASDGDARDAGSDPADFRSRPGSGLAGVGPSVWSPR